VSYAPNAGLSDPPEPLTPVRFPHRAAAKADTRRRLVQSALHLFRTKGYDQTTIGEIARRAGTGQRTFYVHFPTKADVLFDVPPEVLDQLADAIVVQPPGRSDLEALLDAVIEWVFSSPSDLPLRHEQLRLMLDAAATSPAIRGKQMDYNETVAQTAARALARRNQQEKPDLATVTTARITMWTHHAALIEWASNEPDALKHVLERHLKCLRLLTASATTREKSRHSAP
jgi:AcrR family transcriptional regulator